MASKPLTPKEAFRRWAEAHEVYPARLARELKCTDAHAWEILRGERPISLETLGRLLVVYGADGPAIAIADSMRVELRELYGEPAPVI